MSNNTTPININQSPRRDLPTTELPSTEQEYLELSAQFKETMDEKDRELTRLKKRYMELKKDFARTYGLIRELSNYLDNVTDICGDPCYELLSESIRSIASGAVFYEEEKILGLMDIDDISGLAVIYHSQN